MSPTRPKKIGEILVLFKMKFRRQFCKLFFSTVTIQLAAFLIFFLFLTSGWQIASNWIVARNAKLVTSK